MRKYPKPRPLSPAAVTLVAVNTLPRSQTPDPEAWLLKHALATSEETLDAALAIISAMDEAAEVARETIKALTAEIADMRALAYLGPEVAQ
jgi:hypothetical protein